MKSFSRREAEVENFKRDLLTRWLSECTPEQKNGFERICRPHLDYNAPASHRYSWETAADLLERTLNKNDAERIAALATVREKAERTSELSEQSAVATPAPESDPPGG